MTFIIARTPGGTARSTQGAFCKPGHILSGAVAWLTGLAYRPALRLRGRAWRSDLADRLPDLAA